MARIEQKVNDAEDTKRQISNKKKKDKPKNKPALKSSGNKSKINK